MTRIASGMLCLFAFPIAVCVADEPYKATPRKKDDTVKMSVAKDQVICEVTCPSGIGGLKIERQGEAWPKTMLMRLHIRGLEHFHASAGGLALGAALSSPEMTRSWLEKDGKSINQDAGDPLHLEVRVRDRDGTPVESRMSPKGGSIEVVIPEAFFREKPEAITISWIDFYR